MRTKLFKGTVLALTVAFAACDEATGPDGQTLNDGENEFLALQTDQIVNFMVDDAVAAAFGEPSAGVTLAADQVVDQAAVVDTILTRFEFERSRRCPVSGSVVATGTGHKLQYGQTVEWEVSGNKHQIECARVRGDVVITINGAGEFNAYRKRVEGTLVEARSAAWGAFRYETSNGRRGSCEYRILREWDARSDQIHVVGNICGHEIDKVIDRPRDSA